LSVEDITNGVRIKNIDSEAYPTIKTYVRVRLVAIWRDADGNGTGVEIHPLYDLNSTEWVQDEAGEYYYYKDVLEPDEISEILFTA
jgi:hypothetical protein